MNIIALDDEKIALAKLCDCISEAAPGDTVYGFYFAKQAIEFVAEHHVDVAFIDIDLQDMQGIELAQILKVNCPDISIIFVTGYISPDIHQFYTNGYILKPFLTEDIKKELLALHSQPIKTEIGKEKRYFIQCFGSFSVYCDGHPLCFRYRKAEELFAFLVDRGGQPCTNREVDAMLFQNHHNLWRNQMLLFYLMSKLPIGTLIRKGNSIRLNIENLSCDYFDFIAGKVSAINAYTGKYMTQYSWAELRLDTINKLRQSEKAFESQWFWLDGVI